MGTVLAFANQKGGVGKTTTASESRHLHVTGIEGVGFGGFCHFSA